MQFKVEPIDRPREQVEKQLRQAIISSALQPGQRLPSETQLAKDFHVSRATVREALRSLAANGLISKQQGAAGGSFVEAVDHESLAAVIATSMDTILKLGRVTHTEVGGVREMLEVPAARLAATNATAEQLAELEELHEAEASPEVKGPVSGDLDLRFHNLVAVASGNRVLSAMFSALVRVPGPPPDFDFVETGEDVRAELRRQRRELLDALATRDPDAAGQAMARHVAYFHRVVRGVRGPAENVPANV